jgi:hypothetical protein
LAGGPAVSGLQMSTYQYGFIRVIGSAARPKYRRASKIRTDRRTPRYVTMLACNSGLIAARSTAARKYRIYVRACKGPFRFFSIAFVSFVHTIFPFTFHSVLSLPVVISLFSFFICAFFVDFFLSLSLTSLCRHVLYLFCAHVRPCVYWNIL